MSPLQTFGRVEKGGFGVGVEEGGKRDVGTFIT